MSAVAAAVAPGSAAARAPGRRDGTRRKRRISAVITAVTLAAWLSVPSGAGAHAAAPAFVVLDYDVAAVDAGDCPDADEFRASVQRQLGYDPFRADGDRRVAVQIARKESGFGGHIRWSDLNGSWVGDRQLSSRRPDCAVIAASLAFSVAVQIQLMATLAPAAAAPTPPSDATRAADPAPDATAIAADPRRQNTKPAPAPATAAPVPSAPAPASRLRLSIGLGPSLAIGVAPQTTGLARMFVRASGDALSLELAADAALPVKRDDVGGGGFSLDRFAASAAGCGHTGPFAACVTGALGRYQAHGFGVDAPAAPAGFFSQVGARIMATHDFARYFAALRADGLIMTSRSTVTLNQTRVWTTPRVGALFGLDLGAHFF